MGVYRKIILKCVIKKYSVKALNGFRGLRILSSSQALVKVVMSIYVTYTYHLSYYKLLKDSFVRMCRSQIFLINLRKNLDLNIDFSVLNLRDFHQASWLQQ